MMKYKNGQLFPWRIFLSELIGTALLVLVGLSPVPPSSRAFLSMFRVLPPLLLLGVLLVVFVFVSFLVLACFFDAVWVSLGPVQLLFCMCSALGN